ncbi:class I SAM-dependent methyltransferase [Rhodophyticola sp.]|uniref:class I SAM-dependent methyltransferase n=1 Tax=Rhodophyticola sp. TaxID=2680032 RepID=UPI003D2A0249
MTAAGRPSGWDASAVDWSAQLRAGYDRVREEYNWPAFLRLLGPLDGLDVVDVGCGDGEMTRRLRAAGARIVGLDPSAEMISAARAATGDAAIRYETVPADAPTAGLSNGSMDLVIGFMVVMSARDLDALAAGAARVLRPGGRLCLALLHPCFSHSGMRWSKSEGRRILELLSYDSRRDVLGTVRFQGAQERGKPGFVVLRQERTLADTLAPFLAAGLRLADLTEPRPTATDVVANKHLRRWRTVAPAFLHLAFER